MSLLAYAVAEGDAAGIDGVVVSGHITLTVADIDLVELDLAIILASTDKLAGR